MEIFVETINDALNLTNEYTASISYRHPYAWLTQAQIQTAQKMVENMQELSTLDL